MSRIAKVFSNLKAGGGRAFIPYVMAGDPSLGRTEEVVVMLERAGADIVELGVPFTDPVADGPTIQRAAERALDAGVRLRDVLALVERLRKRVSIPIVLMSYYNPVFRYGEEAFMREAGRVGVDGLIVPDLPPDEARGLVRLSRRRGVDVIFLIAPNSPPERIKLVAGASRGFIYYVSITGITGARLELGSEAAGHVEAVRRAGGLPVALGFGVSSPEEAAAAAKLADGVIVGSAIVKRIGDPGLEDFVRGLRTAIGERPGGARCN